MSRRSRCRSVDFLYRIDIYLPLKNRQGNRVEPRNLYRLRDAIVRKFGGLTMTPIVGNPVYDGFWKSRRTKRVVKDKNSIFSVLVPQTEDSIKFFLRRKATWQRSLNYEELLITVHELHTV